eukprot:g2782.t1
MSALVKSLLSATARMGAQGDRTLASNLVAFSGGVDSSVVAALVFRAFPETAVAVLGVSPAVPQDQIELARHVAETIGIPLREISTREGDNPLYVRNSGDACFHCKTELYTTLNALGSHASEQLAKLDGSQRHAWSPSELCESSRQETASSPHCISLEVADDTPLVGHPGEQTEQLNRVVLFNGTNADDMTDPTRVGLVAAKNFSVKSPLASISKVKVREAARYLGLPNHAHAAAPCLRSRLAHGVLATDVHLRAVESAERIVRDHLSLGVSDNLRVRLLAGGRSALEVDAKYLHLASDAADALAPVLSGYGFEKLEVRAFKSGSVNGLVHTHKKKPTTM